MTVHEQFRSNNILWLALLGGQLLIAFLFVFVVADKEGGIMMPIKGFSSTLLTIALAVMAAAVFFSDVIYKKKKAEIAELKTLDEKLKHYRTTFIIRAALIEGGCLMALNLMFIENNLAFFLVVGMGVLFFLRTRPSIEQFKNEYPLTSAEKAQLPV